jgi:hypothetical protein
VLGFIAILPKVAQDEIVSAKTRPTTLYFDCIVDFDFMM